MPDSLFRHRGAAFAAPCSIDRAETPARSLREPSAPQGQVVRFTALPFVPAPRSDTDSKRRKRSGRPPLEHELSLRKSRRRRGREAGGGKPVTQNGILDQVCRRNGHRPPGVPTAVRIAVGCAPSPRGRRRSRDCCTCRGWWRRCRSRSRAMSARWSYPERPGSCTGRDRAACTFSSHTPSRPRRSAP